MRFRYGCLLLLLLMFLPLGSVLVAASIASAHACELSSAGVRPCVVLGHDVGGLLSVMGLIGWASLGTIPLGFVVGGLWGIALWIQRKKSHSPDGPVS